MRVDMRPWVLVYLCSIGMVGGSACSARSLLAITLKTNGLAPGAAVFPRVDVTRPGGAPVRTVDKTDGGDVNALLIIDDRGSTQVGVYLPSDVDGTVQVTAALRSSTSTCELSGSAAQPVSVSSGGETSVTVTLDHRSGDCTTATGDGGSDVGGTSDGESRDGADGMNDVSVGNTVADCIAYCAAYVDACASWGPDQPACVSMCDAMSWQAGTGDAATGENSFSCRMRHLRAAADAALDCSECYAASPESAGICGPPVDGAVRGACPNG